MSSSTGNPKAYGFREGFPSGRSNYLPIPVGAISSDLSIEKGARACIRSSRYWLRARAGRQASPTRRFRDHRPRRGTWLSTNCRPDRLRSPWAWPPEGGSRSDEKGEPWTSPRSGRQVIPSCYPNSVSLDFGQKAGRIVFIHGREGMGLYSQVYTPPKFH